MSPCNRRTDETPGEHARRRTLSETNYETNSRTIDCRDDGRCGCDVVVLCDAFVVDVTGDTGRQVGGDDAGDMGDMGNAGDITVIGVVGDVGDGEEAGDVGDGRDI